MAWEETTFERKRLYAEVWAEPVNAVAKRYDISDVGLRKICIKLGVPMPPLGYWAKIAAGKSPRIAALPSNFKSSTTYVRRRHVDEAAPERERRVATLLAAHRPEIWPTASITETLDDSHPVVSRTARALRSNSTDPTKVVSATGRDIFEVRVSQAQRDRALRILQGCLEAFAGMGIHVVACKPEGLPVHLNVLKQFVSFKLEELMDRTLREPTAKEKAEQDRYSWMKPDLRVYAPNGKLRLTVLSNNRYANYLSVSDGASPIADRLGDIVERVMTKAAELAVEHEMREEEHQRWEARAARRRAMEAERTKELERLKATEEAVQQWHRAKLLREYASALESSAALKSEGDANREVAWIRNAADWLDPLVEKTWPQVDIDKR